MSANKQTKVPFFRAAISDQEIAEVCDTLRSGWLTSGAKVRRFEQQFAETVDARHAIAVNSCTAALHLAVEAMGLKRGEAVLIPTMTFAATAEVVRYLGAVPILVDCDPVTANLDLVDAARKIAQLRTGKLLGLAFDTKIVGIIPVHVGGIMMDIEAVHSFVEENNLWVVEDAAHAFPAAWRKNEASAWQYCGNNTASVSCFSFYANKTITTGEGGMAVTNSDALADRIRLMSLHGLSHDAWQRYSGGGWDYKIVAPGFKYNLTDIAAALGIHQLARAEVMRVERLAVADLYFAQLAAVNEIELPPTDSNRQHSWHLFPIKLRLDRLSISRNQFIEELKSAEIGCSVHWRPLHLHPYYQKTFGWSPDQFPAATALWERLISLPIFPGISTDELTMVTSTIKAICRRNSKANAFVSGADGRLRMTA
jgi:perosamine synthetase